MKKILAFTLLFIAYTTNAQIIKNVGDFNKVTAFDKITVKLIASDENRIELNGKFEEEAELINYNGELKIRLPIGKFLNGEDLYAFVYFKDLEAIEANEGSNVSCESEIKTIDFTLIAKEGSQIEVAVNSQKITVKSANGSIIKLSGETQNLDVVTNSGGIFEGEDCISSQTTVSVNAGGYAKVYATDLVDAKTRAGGTITIYGKPKKINQKSVLGGTIEEN